ncbi:aldose 1-epimerase [Lachnospiraceae bacterium C10]|jgi:aldose 1-epimerase|nr:aldose 1-epimerase [Lachnospiraceae bacterium C10]
MEKVWGKTPDGQDVKVVEIKKGGLRAKVMNFGANLLELHVTLPSKDERDVVLGFRDLESYFTNDPNYGCSVGRHANRIGGAAFDLDGTHYELDKNDGECNNLHSGFHPLHKRIWDIKAESDNSITFAIHSPAGDMGFPGNMDIEVTYTIGDKQDLIIDYKAISDEKTVFNPTNHSYFNLKGAGEGNILDHKVTIHSDQVTYAGADSIPTGEYVQIKDTPMDFATGHVVGGRIEADYDLLKFAGGYDHNYVLKNTEEYHEASYDHNGKNVYEAAVFSDPMGELFAHVYTDLPGMQLYTGNYISGTDLGKDSKIYSRRGGICFETQYYPNALNVPSFPQPIIEAGKEYNSRTVYRFDQQ